MNGGDTYQCMAGGHRCSVGFRGDESHVLANMQLFISGMAFRRNARSL
jgi:glutathionylspermidine synthase